MTVKSIAAGAAALAAIWVAGAALTGPDAASAGIPVTVQVQPVVFSAPLPQAPPTPSAEVPSTEQVTDILTRLTDPGPSYKEKGNLVQNGIDPHDGHVLDHELHKSERDGELPYTFDVVKIAPTGAGQAAAEVTISGPKRAAQTSPLTFVDQGGWKLSHDSAVALVQALSAP